jgi:type VI secretion system protein ImpF
MQGEQRLGRLNPTLLDKLLADHEIAGMQGAEMEQLEQKRDTLRSFSVPQGQRFTEKALRATVRRELAWLLNTTNFAAVIDLDPYPHIKTSVLNYGVPDLSGKSLNSRLIQQRAREIRAAITAFEPRINAASLEVEVAERVERENAVTYVIQADITTAIRAIPVKFRTDIEADSAAATVRE